MASIGENNVPILMAPMKGSITGAPADLQQQQRQVLGNVGNAGLALIQQQQHKKKEQHFLNQVKHLATLICTYSHAYFTPHPIRCVRPQELRKDPEVKSVISSAANSGVFSIYTDSSSPGQQHDASSGRFSGSATDDSENLPPKVAAALLPSVQHGEHANQCFATGLPVPAAVPIQGMCQLEDKNRYGILYFPPMAPTIDYT